MNIYLIEPLEVLAFHHYIRHATLILTDSGGIQEEATSVGKPVFVLRETTERPEGVASGTLKLVGTNKETIVENVTTLLEDQEAYKKMSIAQNPYGDGHSASKIAKIILDELS